MLNLLAKSAGYQNYQSLKSLSERASQSSPETAKRDYSAYTGNSVNRYMIKLSSAKARILSQELGDAFPDVSILADDAGVSRTAALELVSDKGSFSGGKDRLAFSLSRLLGISPEWFLLDQGALPDHIKISEHAEQSIQAARNELTSVLVKVDVQTLSVARAEARKQESLEASKASLRETIDKLGDPKDKEALETLLKSVDEVGTDWQEKRV